MENQIRQEIRAIHMNVFRMQNEILENSRIDVEFKGLKQEVKDISKKLDLILDKLSQLEKRK